MKKQLIFIFLLTLLLINVSFVKAETKVWPSSGVQYHDEILDEFKYKENVKVVVYSRERVC
ncbi:hypothetical protein GW932_00825 [archaeon]|nr:hypothetical protein [archaeon]